MLKLEEAEKQIIDAYRTLANLAERILVATPSSAIVELPISSAVDSTNAVFSDPATQVFACRVELAEASSRFFAAWLVRAIFDAERTYKCRIRVVAKGTATRLREATQLSSPLVLLASGESPEDALSNVISEAKKFRSDMFDSDGFLIDH